jgi:tetratricopeptide (TPR) repeat protein
MQTNDLAAADDASRRLIAAEPDFAAGWHAASSVALRLGRIAEALSSIERALIIEPLNPRFHLHRAQCLAVLSRWADAIAAAATATACAPADPAVLDAAGSVYSYGNDQTSALAAYDQAVLLAPNNPGHLFNRATVHRFLGQLSDAEDDYDRVVSLNPRDYEAQKNRSDLRTQTAARNHTAELERLLTQLNADPRGEVQLRYALAKEYEDLSEYAKSFEQLQRGARVRRAHMPYEVAQDVATVDWIIEAFPRRPIQLTRGAATAEPIFIVSLPRSGSTLVDRMLSGHSQVFSAGELNHFALAVVDAARSQSGFAKLTRRALVKRSAAVDFEALGRDYLRRTRPATGHTAHFTDKMPLNYLYCGLIHRALPEAKIVHVTRHPMAACYAMFKTLFKDGYPFSYDLRDLGHYYVAYRKLMKHWCATMPGVIHEVRYEDLVADPFSHTHQLLEFCGLAWEDACAKPHQNPAPTTTASAAQVRRPIYDSSVAQWRNYEKQLAGLATELQAAGIALEDRPSAAKAQ